MRNVSFGFMLFTNESVPRTVEQVRLGEQLGFESAWLVDSQLVVRDVFVALTACALGTSKIRLGPGVTHTVTRHPTVVAGGFASLAELAPGRTELQVGFGDSAIRGLGGKPARLEQFRQDFLLIRSLLDGEAVPYNDRIIKLAWSNPELTRRIPMYAVPGTGPKGQTLAGELGHGVGLFCRSTHLRAGLDRVAEGAARVGKSLKEMDLIWWVSASISNDWDRVREHLAPRLANSIRHRYYDYRRGAVTEEELGLDVAVARRVAEEYNFLEHATPGAHARLLDRVPERVWKEGMLVGTPEEVAQELRQTLARHPEIKQVVLHLPVATPRLSIEDVLEGFATKVRPRLAAQE